jgi:peptidyl-prolyl cis-trans isomerase C
MLRSNLFSSARSAALAVVATVALLLTGCGNSTGSNSNAEDDPIAYQVGEPLNDSTYAVIVTSEYGSDTLTADDYRQQAQMLMSRIPPNQMTEERRQELHRNLVEQFATRHVLLGEARQSDIMVDSARVNMQMRQMRSQFQSEEQFQQALAASGMTADSLRGMAAANIRIQMMQEEIANEVEDPSESEIEQYRRDQQQEEISARHILFQVSENAPQDTLDSIRATAQAILDSAQTAGVDFGALARRHSEGPTASRGGDLGYFTRDRMVEPFADAAFALSDSGSVADELVRTRFGFHIIQLTGRRMQAMMDTSQARQNLMNERRRTVLEDQRDELLAKATVRVHPAVVEADLDG